MNFKEATFFIIHPDELYMRAPDNDTGIIWSQMFQDGTVSAEIDFSGSEQMIHIIGQEAIESVPVIPRINAMNPLKLRIVVRESAQNDSVNDCIRPLGGPYSLEGDWLR